MAFDDRMEESPASVLMNIIDQDRECAASVLMIFDTRRGECVRFVLMNCHNQDWECAASVL